MLVRCILPVCAVLTGLFVMIVYILSAHEAVRGYMDRYLGLLLLCIALCLAGQYLHGQGCRLLPVLYLCRYTVVHMSPEHPDQ